MSEFIRIGNRRELFWDDYLINTHETTATLMVHHPVAKEAVMVHGEAWEGDGCDYHCIVKDEGFYRMYYLGWQMMNEDATKFIPSSIVVCYAESKDGLEWVKPDLGICEYRGSKENNIILDENTMKFDNFFVFKDDNPDCRAGEKYKGIGSDSRDGYLWCFTSADGIHFERSRPMTNQGKFDTLNVALWDQKTCQYMCFIRDFHNVPNGNLNAGVRDIRRIKSKDFVRWTDPEMICFGDQDDIPLYTNAVQKYYRADHMLIGFPSRYIEKKEWTPNFDQLAGADRRKKRMKLHPRYGLTITDCVFMSSRDGINWNRFDEAFITPGLESELNWVYGDCYPAVGLIETKSDIPNAPNDLSMYCFENHWSGIPTNLRRYTIRTDGFASYHSGYKQSKIVTKPFLYTGNSLSVNFATSAIGYIIVKLICEGQTMESIEHFGNTYDRNVIFGKGNIGSFSGKPVIMEILMMDADIYSFQFDERSIV